jgi:hypothetical protein
MAGPLKRKIGKGETIVSIARENGLPPDRIWDHPDNAELKKKRETPNILAEGDELVLPDRRLKEESRPTESRHKFKLKGQKVKLKLKFLKAGQPRKNERYVLDIDGALTEGSTDGDGKLEQMIPADAAGGRVMFDDGREAYPLRIGHLDPQGEVSGVQQRLNNLGFRAGAEDGKPNPQYHSALRRFQAANKLEETGEADDATRSKLRDLHP